MKTFVAFFEIPAINMERAVQFYGTVFGEKLEIVEYGEEKMAFISSGDQQPIGCIFSLKGYLPTSNSITISFYTENMDESLAMVRKAGGKIATEPCETCEGSKDYFAYFRCRGKPDRFIYTKHSSGRIVIRTRRTISCGLILRGCPERMGWVCCMISKFVRLSLRN